MSEKKRIYLTLETQRRELDSRIFFACIAANKNYSVVIGKKNSLYKYSPFFKKGLFIFKSMGLNNIKPSKILKKQGHRLFAWDEEGLTVSDPIVIKKRVMKECLENLDYIFTWGIKQKKILTNIFPEFSKKFQETGHPRFDLFYNEMKKFYKHNNGQSENNFILVTSKFPKGNPLPKGDVIPRFEKHYYNQVSSQQKLFSEYLKIIKKINYIYPDQKIFIRPHPAENIDIWRQQVKNIKNTFIITNNESTCNLISKCKFLICTNCTTGVEAYFLNKYSINYEIIEDKENDYDLVKATCETIKSEDELFNKISEIISKENLNKKLIQPYDQIKIKEHIANYDMKYFSVDKILNFLKDSLVDLSKDKRTNYLYFNIFKLVRYLKNIYYSKKNQNTYHYKLSSQKFDKIDLLDLQTKSENICNNLNLKKVNIKEIYPGLYRFECK